MASNLGQILIRIGQIKPRRRFSNNCIFKASSPAAASRSATLRTEPFASKSSSGTINTRHYSYMPPISFGLMAAGDKRQRSGTAPEGKSTQSLLEELEIVTSSRTHKQLSPADSVSYTHLTLPTKRIV